jgi:hypothetical protein
MRKKQVSYVKKIEARITSVTPSQLKTVVDTLSSFDLQTLVNLVHMEGEDFESMKKTIQSSPKLAKIVSTLNSLTQALKPGQEGYRIG